MERLRANLPNSLTLMRLVLGLAFYFLPPALWLPVVILAAASDALDGYLARVFDVQSEFGRILDPIADRVFVGAMALTLLFETQLTVGQLFLVGLRDLVVVFGALVIVAVGQRSDFERIKTRIFGKLATVFQFAFLLSVIVIGQALWSLVALTAFFSGLAGADYIRSYFRDAFDTGHSAKRPREA